MYSSSQKPDKPYKTVVSDDPFAGARAEKERLRAKVAVGELRLITGRIRDRAIPLTEEQKRERKIARLRQDDEDFKRRQQREEAIRKAKHRFRQRTKGAIGPRRGTYDEFATVTARFDRLNLDPDSRPRGSGFFWDGGIEGPEQKGTFIATFKNKRSKFPDPELTVEEVMRGMAENGPDLPGCGFVRYGEGDWPGEGRPGQNPQQPGMDEKWDSWTQTGATEDFVRSQNIERKNSREG